MPDEDGGVLAANLTSIDSPDDDQGCRLEPADYPVYIEHPTTVRYNKADIYPASRIAPSPYLMINEPVPPETLRKIQKCGIESDNLKKKFRAWLSRETGIPLPP
jgi:hypothetical protein